MAHFQIVIQIYLKSCSVMAEQQENEITIEDLERELDLYEIESEGKLDQLKKLFSEKGSLDLAKMFYEQRSQIEIRFQCVIRDLVDFLVGQQVPTTQKIRKTFYRILENPLLLLFKVSRFQIFQLRLDGFDIELEPIEAVKQLSKTLDQNIDDYLSIIANQFEPYDGKQYKNIQSFMEQATINKIQDKIFVFYNYLRKGAKVFKKKFEEKALIVDMFNKIENKLLPILLQRADAKTIKELSVLNYQIYELQPTFEVLYFFIHIPLTEKYKECFQELELIGSKAKQASNYNNFILLFIKHDKQILSKLQNSHIDINFKSFIENALKSILEMWGCRICYFKEFCELFTSLFRLHPNQTQALQLTLKHNPNLTKDDIVLLRTNFKLEISNKHNELLTLLKSMSLEQVNQFLNNFYHRTLYNMSFKDLDRQKIIGLLSLMNGNSSLAQLFLIAERAFKEWNYTIDFTHSHKFIETEFAYPKINDEKVKQSLVLLTNLCVMEEKGFNNQYANLIKAGAIGKILLQFVKFLQVDQKSKPLLQWPQTQRFFSEAFYFLRKVLNPATQTQKLVNTFSTLLGHLTQEQRKSLEERLICAIQENVDSFHIEDCLNCFKKYLNQDMKKVLDIFMSEVEQNNQLVRKFGYLEQKVEDLERVTLPQQHIDFIVSKYRINNGRVVFKDPGIFNLSDLEILTIPSQIDKVMDNYYFTLDSNAKKFIEYLVHTWNQNRLQKTGEFNFYNKLLISLINSYPIAVPLIASTRLEENGGSRRFIQLLSIQVCQDQTYSEIILNITKCKAIRYKNGKDYIQEEVVPMAMKEIIRNINCRTNLCGEQFYVLAKLLERANLSDIKIETIQKSIEKVRLQLTKCTEPSEAKKFSSAYQVLMEQFFSKKQIEMRKQDLTLGYRNLIWNQVRNYVSNTSENNSQLKDETITEYIVISPFTITHEFNINDYKIKKATKKKSKTSPETLVPMSDVLKKLSVFQNPGVNYSFFNNKTENRKKLDASSLKYDLEVYLGSENVKLITEKQNVELTLSTSPSKEQPIAKKNEDNNSFIQYYMKSLAMPSISHKVILQDVASLLEGTNDAVSFLWTNSKNLQNYFMNLLSIFQFASLEAGKRNPENQPEISKIVSLVNADSVRILKKVLKVFSELGYSNIWAESYDIFWSNFPIRKLLGFNNKSDEGFLSIILRNTLERPQLREDLTAFLGSLFETRKDQNALMYKVSMDKNLMNTIMKSLSIPHLQKISLMFHSNFNNLRLYTDQLHQGLKALNIASKNRAYNEYIKISKSVEDEEFSGPLKLFKQNFSFFIRIEKEGYKFKKTEETNLALGRLSNVLRNAGENENISSKVNEVLEEYIKQITELQLAIANRVKSFYLVTKLRDLSYQNAIMIPIIHEVMHSTGKSEQEIIDEINKVEIFSLMSRLYNDLVRYEDDWRSMEKYSSKHKFDGYVLQNQLTLCSTRRFSHSMSKVYQKCDLEFDEVMQRCVDALKVFFSTGIGNRWVQSVDVYPPFLVKSFVDNIKSKKLFDQIFEKVRENSSNYQFSVNDKDLVEGLIKGFRLAPRSSFSNKGIVINYNNSKKSPVQMLKPLQERLINNETFVVLKGSGNIIFNKFKSSQATLEEIEILGYIIAYAILNNLAVDLSLHPSIVCALSFNIAQLDYLLDIDFKTWEELKNILSVEDSSQLALNFSYNFESLDNLKPIRIELIDKGSSKKVNNLNREEYCDLICCYVLYEYVRPQIQRLLTTILSIAPKQLISCMSTKQILNKFYSKQKSQKILDDYMKKIGVVLPETLIDEKGKRIENLKDFQNVSWLQELILEDESLRVKYWKDEQNLFVVTTISGQPGIRVVNGKFLVEHFGSKEEMKRALSKL